jgi:hypothetical protein
VAGEARAEVEWKVSFFRKYPFASEDPLDIMLEKVEEQARQEGAPLTADEQRLLRAEYDRNVAVDSVREVRFRKLVSRILDAERSDAQISSDYRKRSFGNAIEWAGDRAYPYVVHLAEEDVRKWSDSHPEPLRAHVMDKLRLLGWALAVVLGMFTVIVLIAFLTNNT